MADLKITDLVDQKDIDKLQELNKILATIKENYAGAAKELVVAIKLNVDKYEDLNKLSAIINSSMVKAQEANDKLNVALVKQAELTAKVAGSIDKQIESGNLSATQMKKLTDASKKNAESLEKLAKAEATVEKAQKASNTTKKSTNVTEQERQKIIADAIAATYKEIHSIQEANDMNKQLRKAVKLVRDTDEEYIQTVGRLNSTIGVNTDYVKRNSDRYTQQKMTVGDYTESVKRAWMEIQRGNSSMKSMGIIAKNTGNLLKTSFNSGVDKVTVSIGTMIKGMVGAQAVIGGIQQLFGLLKRGINTAIEFEAANSKLAAILGTTADKTRSLQMSARELGATTKYTAAEATNLQIELAKLGFTAEEIQQSTKFILRFAQATGAELPEAAALAGASLRMFNADTTETERYVSAMGVATTKSALSFSYLQTALPIAGSVAKTFGFEIEDVLALLGKLADAGVDASSAATATRNILLNLANGSGKLSKAMGGNIKTLDDFVKGLKNVNDEGVELAEMLELTDKRSVNAFANFVAGADDIETLRKSITGVSKEFGEMADEVSNNTAGAIKSLSSAWDELMISIYGNTGAIRELVEVTTAAIRDIALLLQSEGTAAEKMISAAMAATASEEDYKRDIDAIERKKQAFIKAGEDETAARKKANEEQVELLERTIAQETKLRDGAKLKFDKALSIMNDENASKALKKTAEQSLKDYANEYSSLISSVTILESRLSRIKTLGKVGTGTNSGTGKLTDAEKKALEKAAKEKLKIEQDFEASKMSLMNEGLEKQIKSISLNYNKQIAAIRGNSKEEIATRKNLAEKMEKEISEAKIKFAQGIEKGNLSNRLATVQKDTQEELDLKMQMLDLEREGEIKAAEKSSADVSLIDEKYLKKRQELQEEFASKQILLIADNAAAEQAVRDRDYQTELLALKKRKETENMSAEQYAEEEYKIKLDYVRKTTEAAIEAIEEELKVDNLSTKDRTKLTEDLYKLKADLSNKEAEAEITAIEKINKADEEARKKRIKNLQKWLQTASQAVGAIGDLIGTLYDGQLNKIDEESEANSEAHDAEIERIEKMEERGVLSKEEAEARKRAADDKTRKKEEELEKKRRDIQYKQAVWDKASSIAQAGIATALAITKALPNFVLAGIAAAMGAIQVATILATPIPKYANGTDSHRGGPAIVGDGGRNEVVLSEGKVWITPSVPTLVELPSGAQVLPNVEDMVVSKWGQEDFLKPSAFTFLGNMDNEKMPVFVNDNSGVEKGIRQTNDLLLKMMKKQNQDAIDRELELYIMRRI